MAAGGVESVVYNYYRSINHTEVQFDFFVDENSDVPFPEQLKNMGARVYLIPPYKKIVPYLAALIRLLRENQYTIVHAHVNTMNVFPLLAAWCAGVPVRICHNHSTAYWGEKKTVLKYILRPFSTVFATDYFACGEKAGRWMYGNRRFEQGDVHVMPNAIPVEKFAFDPEAGRQLRAEFNIPQGAFVVGHVGRLTYAKNHQFLLNLFAELRRENPDAWLLLIGGGELEQSIKECAKKLGIYDRVVFAGARSDVGKIYSAMDVFCLPSLYEGLPVVALEAQANGLPCIFSDQITPEVIFANARAISLNDPKSWLTAVVGSRRWEGPGLLPNEYNVACAAQKLTEFYRKKEEEQNHETD